MKIKVKKRNLETAIQFVTIALGSGDDTNLCTYYLLRYQAENTNLSVFAQNGGRISAQAPLIEAIVEAADGDEEFTIPGGRLRSFLSTIKNGEEEVTIKFSDNILKISSKRGAGQLPTIDPKGWPHWKEALAEAKTVATMNCMVLSNALSYAKTFVSDQETRQPSIVALDCKKGVLSATDSVGVALIKVPGLIDSNLRVHGKDVPAILSFLGLKGSDDVEIREQDRSLFLVRGDGSLMGITRWIYDFPVLKSLHTDRNLQSKCFFSLKRDDVIEGIKFISVFAKEKDDRLQCSYENGKVTFSMESGAGSKEGDEQVLSCVEEDNMSSLIDEGCAKFILSRKYVLAVANTFEQDVLKFKVDVAKRNGYVSFFHEKDGAEYFTTLVWIK